MSDDASSLALLMLISMPPSRSELRADGRAALRLWPRGGVRTGGQPAHGQARARGGGNGAGGIDSRRHLPLHRWPGGPAPRLGADVASHAGCRRHGSRPTASISPRRRRPSRRPSSRRPRATCAWWSGMPVDAGQLDEELAQASWPGGARGRWTSSSAASPNGCGRRPSNALAPTPRICSAALVCTDP